VCAAVLDRDLHAPGAVALVAELKRAQPGLPIVASPHVETTLRRTAISRRRCRAAALGVRRVAG
jgi:hypothetical protein